MATSIYPKTILITGATGAIGSALARCYATPGTSLILQGRQNQELQALKTECEKQGARVITYSIDINDRCTYFAWLKGINETEVIDLVIANAGVNTHVGEDGAPETWTEVETLVETNILGVMATVQGVLPFMRSRKRGQIALISSLAAYFGLPVIPTYSASKAAIKAYGESLRGWLAPEGIQVSVIMPGYVSSKMCDAMPGPKPLLWTAEHAASKIKKALELNKPRFSFPFPLNFGTWWLSVLPPRFSQWIVCNLGYRR